MTDCGHRDSVAAYVLRALPDDEHERFSLHLEGCADCRRDVADLQVAADALPLAAVQVAPPPELKDRIMAVVRSESELLSAAGARADEPVPAPAARPPRRRWWSRPLLTLRPLAAAGLATAVLAVGVGAGVLLNGGEDTHTVQAKVALASAPGARASLEVAGHDGRLDVSNFPSAGSDRVYQVWLVRGNGRPASAGLFRVAGNGQATFAIPESLKGVDQVLVSVEPGGGSEQPTTKPVVAASTA